MAKSLLELLGEIGMRLLFDSPQVGWTFPVLRDGDGLVGTAYGIRGLPTIILDRSTRIAQILRGPQSVGDIRVALARVAD